MPISPPTTLNKSLPAKNSGASRDQKATFRELFCASFSCSKGEFEARALGQFLHWPWRWISLWLLAKTPDFFVEDFRILGRIGETEDIWQYTAEVREIRFDYERAHDFGPARKRLKLRLSSQRMRKFGRMLWQQGANDQAD